MKHRLESIGYYISPPGGSPNPYIIRNNTILFEMITAGAVYDPSSHGVLRSRGWIFAHVPGQQTLSRSEVDGHYECVTMLFTVKNAGDRNVWQRSFSWGEEAEGAVSLAHEMLYAFHHTRMDRVILGDLIWSQFRFRLENYKRQKNRKAIPPRVSEVMLYIDRYYADSLGIDELAAHVKLSASHLHARFKEYVGMTPHQYLIRRRMQAARHTLATTDVPIKAVATDIGYINTESFCRAFKQYFRITAAGYRRKYMIY